MCLIAEGAVDVGVGHLLDYFKCTAIFKINEEIHCVLENLGEGGSGRPKKKAPFLAPGLQLVDGCFGLQNSRKSEINLS